jgi:hypothetical protein
MKNVTFSAEEHLIEQARLVARSRPTTLNAAFREWLEQFTARVDAGTDYDKLMKRLKGVQSGGRFSRQELNER